MGKYYHNIKKNLNEVIIESNTKSGRIFDLFIQLLIVFSLVTFSIGTMPELSVNKKRFIEISEKMVVYLFSLEYLFRILLSNKKLKFIFSFYGLIDLISILPFYLTLGIDMRSLRALRLLRIFRVLKFARYNQAILHFSSALKSVREELLIFLFTSIILIYLSAIGIYYFENTLQPEVFASVFDGLWWSVITLTTVGYGDAYPITVGGKLFTFVILLLGLGVVAVPTGIIATALNRTNKNQP